MQVFADDLKVYSRIRPIIALSLVKKQAAVRVKNPANGCKKKLFIGLQNFIRNYDSVGFHPFREFESLNKQIIELLGRIPAIHDILPLTKSKVRLSFRKK